MHDDRHLAQALEHLNAIPADWTPHQVRRLAMECRLPVKLLGDLSEHYYSSPEVAAILRHAAEQDIV